MLMLLLPKYKSVVFTKYKITKTNFTKTAAPATDLIFTLMCTIVTSKMLYETLKYFNLIFVILY